MNIIFLCLKHYFSALENNIHIFAPLRNIFYVYDLVWDDIGMVWCGVA